MSLVGGCPQPGRLIDRAKLLGSSLPRVRTRAVRRSDPASIDEAQGDVTALAILDQERAGVDVISDGEIVRRRSALPLMQSARSRQIEVSWLLADRDTGEQPRRNAHGVACPASTVACLPSRPRPKSAKTDLAVGEEARHRSFLGGFADSI